MNASYDFHIVASNDADAASPSVVGKRPVQQPPQIQNLVHSAPERANVNELSTDGLVSVELRYMSGPLPSCCKAALLCSGVIFSNLLAMHSHSTPSQWTSRILTPMVTLLIFICINVLVYMDRGALAVSTLLFSCYSFLRPPFCIFVLELISSSGCS